MKRKLLKKNVTISALTALSLMLSSATPAAGLTDRDINDLMNGSGVKIGYAAESQERFTDLSGYDWALGAINNMAERGIVVGKESGKYAPRDAVTRQEFALMAIRASGSDTDQLAGQASAVSGNLKLSELNAQNAGYWANNVLCAVQLFPGLKKQWGTSGEEWAKEATRAEMALIVMEISEQLEGKEYAIKENMETNIADYTEFGKTEYEESILKAYSNGILVGKEGSKFVPKDNATRAEAAVIMERVLEPGKRAEVTVEEYSPADTPIVVYDNPEEIVLRKPTKAEKETYKWVVGDVAYISPEYIRSCIDYAVGFNDPNIPYIEVGFKLDGYYPGTMNLYKDGQFISGTSKGILKNSSRFDSKDKMNGFDTFTINEGNYYLVCLGNPFKDLEIQTLEEFAKGPHAGRPSW